MARRKPLDIVFTHAARFEWLAIWHWNAIEYGERRADSYLDFLESKIQMLAAAPEMGVVVPEFPDLRRHLAKRRSRSHGHIIFYRVTEGRLEIIHIYHTAQDWQSKLQDA